MVCGFRRPGYQSCIFDSVRKGVNPDAQCARFRRMSWRGTQKHSFTRIRQISFIHTTLSPTHLPNHSFFIPRFPPYYSPFPPPRAPPAQPELKKPPLLSFAHCIHSTLRINQSNPLCSTIQYNTIQYNMRRCISAIPHQKNQNIDQSFKISRNE